MWDCLMNMLTMIIFALAYSSSSIQLRDIIIIKYILKVNKLAVTFTSVGSLQKVKGYS